MNLNEVINKRFICSYDVFKEYQTLNKNGKTYKISNTLENFIKDNNLSPLYVKKDMTITTFAIKSYGNEPVMSLNGSTFRSSYVRNINIILVEDFLGKILESFIFYVDPRIGSNNNSFSSNDVISVNYYNSYSPDLVSRTITSNNGTIAKMYGFSLNDPLKYYETTKDELNSSLISTPSSIGYKLFLDGESKLGIDLSSKTDLYKIVVEEEYSEDRDGSIKIEENNNSLYKNMYIADENYLPIGTIIPIIKYNSSINSSIKNNYLKMDGSEIPDKPIYKNLRNLLKGTNYQNVIVDKEINELDYKIIIPENRKAVWFIKNQSILDYVKNSNHSNGTILTGNESVTINERYWDGFSISNFGSTNVLNAIKGKIGNIQRAVLDGNSLSKLLNSDLFTLGNSYKSDRTSGNTSTSFSVSDIISVGYAQDSGNNSYYTIYNHTTETYMISGASNMYCDGIGFLQRSYDSKILIAQIGSGKYLFLGTGLSTSSDSNFNTTTVYDFDGNVYSYNDKIYLPDMTEEGIFLGGGDMAGTFKDWTIPNIYGSFRYAGTEGAWAYDAFYTGGGMNTSNFDHSGGTAAYLISMDISRLKGYSTHTNDLSKFYPNHYNVDWYIKYK